MLHFHRLLAQAQSLTPPAPLGPDNWPEMIQWLTEHVKRLKKALGRRLRPLGQRVKAEFNSTGVFQE